MSKLKPIKVEAGMAWKRGIVKRETTVGLSG